MSRLQPFGLLAVGLIMGVVLVPFIMADSAVGTRSIQLQFLLGTYTDLDVGMEPIQEGPITIDISSPTHLVEVFQNQLTAAPSATGHWEVEFEVDFAGSGDLIADVAGAGVSTRLADRVEAPRQSLRVRGEISLVRVADGFQITVHRAPPKVGLEIRSGVIDQVTGVCEAFALIPLMSLDCNSLNKSLSLVGVPLPDSGSELFLSDGLLNPQERAFFTSLAAGSS